MSAKIPTSDYRKLAAKYRISADKENMYTVVSNERFSEGKNDGAKRKGLSLNGENNAVYTTSMQNSSVSKTKFPIYLDDSQENVRSRPRVRKDVCRKEIRARQGSNTLEKTIVSTTKAVEINNPVDLRVVSRRARSSSNNRQVPLDKTIETNDKLFQNRRAYSESRKISSQYCGIQSYNDRKIKYLTDDVKKRTFSSIQMWRDKMRKPYTGTKPKNIAANVLNADKIHAKTKLRKNSVIGFMDLQSEGSQNHATNSNENIEEPNNSYKDIIQKFLSNEIAMVLENLENKSCVKAQVESSNAKFIPENIQKSNLSTTVVFNSSTATPLDGPSSLPLTPTKVRYEKCVMTQKPLIKQEIEFEIISNETMYVHDYLEDIPETERKKEDNAPRLSSRFLRENVNAEQRKLIVGYIIRLGVHCHYSCNIIYQTVKLFNVAIDRILVETSNIQLIALGCLWITLKREAPGPKIPSATVILQLAKDLYIDHEKYLLMYEKKILSAVKFNTRFADPFSLLSYYILNVNRDSKYNIIRPNDIPRVYFCGSYMIDLSMLDENLCDTPAHVIAIAAVELSLRFVYSNDTNYQVWCQVWRSKQSLTEWEERIMNSTKRFMMRHALEYDKFGSNVIYKKYMRSRHGRVTNFLHDKLNTIMILSDEREKIFKL